MKTHFKQLFEYDIWASRRIFDLLEKQFPQNERIYALFSHLLSAQPVWLDRCLGLPQTESVWRNRLPEQIKHDIESYHNDWIAFIDQLQPDDFDRTIAYTNSQGDPFDNRLIDIIRQVTNHGTHHRGELLILMKEEGFVLPNIDYIMYVR
jgi:uncharacterized damage-inducible protein DinB